MSLQVFQHLQDTADRHLPIKRALSVESFSQHQDQVLPDVSRGGYQWKYRGNNKNGYLARYRRNLIEKIYHEVFVFQNNNWQLAAHVR